MPKALISKDNFKTALKTSAKKRSTKTEQDHYLVALKVSGGQITVGALYTCTRTHNASRNANTIEVKVGVRKGALSFYNFPPELVKPLVTRLKARAPQAKLATKYEHEGALDEKDPLQALIGAEWGEDEDDAKKKKGGKKKPVRRTSITLSDSEVEDSHPLYAGADDDDDAWMAAAVDNIGDPFAQMTLPRAPDLPPPPPPPEMSDDAMMDMIASAPSFGDEDDLMDAQQTPGEVVGGIEDWRAQNPRHQRAPSLQQGDDGASHPPPQRPTPGQFGDEVDFFNENPHLRPQPPQPQPSAPPDPTEATTPGWGDETHLQAEADPSAPSAPILDDEQLLDEQMWDDINSMIDTLPRERSRRPAPPQPPAPAPGLHHRRGRRGALGAAAGAGAGDAVLRDPGPRAGLPGPAAHGQPVPGLSAGQRQQGGL